MKQAEPVSIKEFVEWLKKNVHKTWYIVDILKGGFAGAEGHSHLIKYITPHIDTRTMRIYSIEIDGSFPEGNGRMRVGSDMQFDGNILELLESKFPENFKKEKS